jgi:hypothetical protein
VRFHVQLAGDAEARGRSTWQATPYTGSLIVIKV